MRTLFVVQGITGEFSDRAEWIVCGYGSKAKAERRAAELNALAQTLMPQEFNEEGVQLSDFWSKLEEATAALRLHDPAGYMDYTGTWYTLSEVTVDLDEE